MDFDLWAKVGSLPYRQTDLEAMFESKMLSIVFVQNQEEHDILTGCQYVFGNQMDIRLHHPGASVNPWVYDVACLFLTWNPIHDH